MSSSSAPVFSSLKNLSPGKYLQGVRRRLGMGVQQVEEASLVIAAEEKSRRYHISIGRLAQIENDCATPSAHKLLTLSAVYGIDYYKLLGLYGIHPDRAFRLWSLLPHAATHLVSPAIRDPEATVRFPSEMRAEFSWETTHLVSRAVEMWSDLPATVLERLSSRTQTYGYIGLEDYTMCPLLRPGTLVKIDVEQRRVVSHGWADEFDRPIYFVESRDRYRCGWCQVAGGKLMILPHPSSSVAAEILSFPHEAEIVGQVVEVVMPLGPVAVARAGRECPGR